MSAFTISLNQLVEAGKATQKGKLRIVEQQINVNKFLTPWYQLAKNRIKLYLKNVRDFAVLRAAVVDLKAKVPKDEKAKNNIMVSIEAIDKVRLMALQNVLPADYEVIIPEEKNLEVGNINVNINPDLIFRYREAGKVKLGAVKFHVSKSKPFDLQQSRQIANLLSIYLENKIIRNGEVVDPDSCWAYDIFADRLIHAEANRRVTSIETKKLCSELEDIYNQI